MALRSARVRGFDVLTWQVDEDKLEAKDDNNVVRMKVEPTVARRRRLSGAVEPIFEIKDPSGKSEMQYKESDGLVFMDPATETQRAKMSKNALEMDDASGVALAKLEAAAGFQALDTNGAVHFHADASGMEVLDAAGVVHFKVASAVLKPST